MLRRAENVRIAFKPGWLTVWLGRTSYSVRKIHKEQFAQGAEAQLSRPDFLLRVKERNYWQFQNRFYWENDDLQPDQIHALLVTKQQRERRRIEQAQQIIAMGEGLRPPLNAGTFLMMSSKLSGRETAVAVVTVAVKRSFSSTTSSP